MPQEPAAMVADIADAAWAHVVATQPYVAVKTGAAVDRLPHDTLDEAERDAAMGRSIHAQLSGIDSATLTASDRDTVALLDYIADEWIASSTAWWWQFPITPYQTYGLSLYGQQIFQPFTFTDAADVERYLSLATDVAGWVRAAHEKVTWQAGRGWGLPRVALPGIVTTMRGHRAATETWLRVAEDHTEQLATSDRGSLLDGIERIITGEVLPAFDNLLDYLDGPAERTAADGVGLWQYPDGEEAYRQLVRKYATFDITPEGVHRLGLEQVEQLTEQMAEVRAAVGFTGDAG